MIEDDEFDPSDDLVKDSATAAKYWKGEIERAQEEFRKWYEKCDKIAKRYRDERDQNRENAKRFNILWSNIQTMKPAVYAKTPKPIIERRFLERNDVERVAGIALQRAVAVELETGCFRDAVGGKQGAIIDYLLYGRGVNWLRYEADLDTTEQQIPLSDKPSDGEEVEQSETKLPTVTAERICIDYVHRKDYLCDPARTEAEVRWKAKRSWLSKRQAKEKFGEIADKVEYHQINDGERYEDHNVVKERRSEFWEIWDKVRRKVWVVNLGYEEGICKVEKDPLGLKNFWPCPKPLYGTMTSDNLVPVPDYVEYQDQAEQLDELSQRIAKITTAIKAVGFYDASQPDLGRLFEFGTDNKMIPCETWAVMKDKGGLDGAVDFFPLKDLITTLQTLQEVFDQQLQRLYEVTGIADIIRGNTSPEETYGAQKIKGQFATLRLQERQREVAEYCREIVEIMTEIIAGHFEPETIAAMTGLADANSADAMFFQGAMQLVGDARLRSFRVDIETNSTIELDIQQDKEDTTEFVSGVGQFMSQILPAAEQMPQLIPLAGNVLLWAIRRFRTGRELESVFERAVDDLTRQAQQPQQKPPSPEELKLQAQREDNQANMALQQQKMQQEAASAERQAQFEMLQHRDDMELQYKTHNDNMELKRLELLGQVVTQDKQQQHELTMKAKEQAHDADQRDQDRGQTDDHKKMDVLLAQDGKKLPNLPEPEVKARDMKKIMEGQDKQTDKVTQIVENQAKLIENMASTHQAHTDAIMTALQKIASAVQDSNKNKRVVRGKDGRISHTEYMQ